jgi:hypothetical protein
MVQANIAKEAFVLSKQLEALHSAMIDAGEKWGGYRAFAETYNVHLARAKQILSLDSTIAKTIEHLLPYDPMKATGFGRDFEQIKADLPLLKAALTSFSIFHLPARERRIGFVS